jgi:hypothetical protein
MRITQASRPPERSGGREQLHQNFIQNRAKYDVPFKPNCTLS